MTRLDPRKPLVFDTRELSRRPGTMQELVRRVEAPEDFGTDVIAIPQGAPLDLELRLESVVEGVLVSGLVTGTASGACVRCLEPATYPVAARFQELYAYPDRAAHHHEVGADRAENGEDEVHELVGDLIDLEPVVRDAVVPSLPFQPVCRPDCPGLCSECGALLALDPDHHHETFDPRWAGLADLLDSTSSTSASSSSTTQTSERTEEKRT